MLFRILERWSILLTFEDLMNSVNSPFGFA
jgi:hypothetical protein